MNKLLSIQVRMERKLVEAKRQEKSRQIVVDQIEFAQICRKALEETADLAELKYQMKFLSEYFQEKLESNKRKRKHFDSHIRTQDDIRTMWKLLRRSQSDLTWELKMAQNFLGSAKGEVRGIGQSLSYIKFTERFSNEEWDKNHEDDMDRHYKYLANAKKDNISIFPLPDWLELTNI